MNMNMNLLGYTYKKRHLEAKTHGSSEGPRLVRCHPCLGAGPVGELGQVAFQIKRATWLVVEVVTTQSQLQDAFTAVHGVGHLQ